MNSLRFDLAKAGFIMMIVWASASCSLKEDRDGCPCHLVIGLENADKKGNADIYIFQEGSETVAAHVVPTDFPEGYIAEVKRSSATVTVIEGLKEGIINDGKLRIRDGNDADRLFLFNETLQCQSETVRTSARLHKNWTTLEISLIPALGRNDTADSQEDSGSNDSATDIGIDISGGICGIDLKSGEPLKGDFRCRARLSDSGFTVFSVNLPRQKNPEDEILVRVRRGKEVLFSADISAAIAKSGFDWTKPDLDDIRLCLDYVSASYSINVSNWDKGSESDRII